MVPIKCDVTSKDDLAAAAEKVRSEVGFVNAVIANSGVSGPQLKGLPEKPSLSELHSYLWKVPMEDITNTFAVNFTAVYYTLLAFMPLLDAGNKDSKSPTTKTGVKSQFIVTASIAAFNRTPTAGFSYGTSKAAVVHLMKQLATYLVPYHIRTNVIAPGLYPSEMTEVSLLVQSLPRADSPQHGLHKSALGNLSLSGVGSLTRNTVQGMLAGTKWSTEDGTVPPEKTPATRLGSEEVREISLSVTPCRSTYKYAYRTWEAPRSISAAEPAAF
jgi:NAD(P)-dependent dehydrogenase (short-subunit alcohol dehydrogenase family)